MPCFLVDCVVRFGRRVEPLTPHFFINVIVKLHVISYDGRQVAVAELRTDMLDDEVKERVTSFRDGFEESVTI